jgi:hypothetical protein
MCSHYYCCFESRASLHWAKRKQKTCWWGSALKGIPWSKLSAAVDGQFCQISQVRARARVAPNDQPWNDKSRQS